MARIAPLPPDSLPHLKGILEAGEKIMGFIPNYGLIMAHRPDILGAFLGLVQAIYAPGKVDNGLKRLIGLITSNAGGCVYCQAHAANAAKQNEVPVEKIEAIWDYPNSPLFTQRERIALRVAQHAGLSPNQVSDEDFAQLKEHFETDEIIEILSVISLFGFLNRWNASLQTDLEEKPAHFYQQLKNKNA